MMSDVADEKPRGSFLGYMRGSGQGLMGTRGVMHCVAILMQYFLRMFYVDISGTTWGHCRTKVLVRQIVLKFSSTTSYNSQHRRAGKRMERRFGWM